MQCAATSNPAISSSSSKAANQDWHHLEDPKDRRKIQNRVAQRNFRRKRKALRDAQKGATTQPPQQHTEFIPEKPNNETNVDFFQNSGASFDQCFDTSSRSSTWSDESWLSNLNLPITPPLTASVFDTSILNSNDLKEPRYICDQEVTKYDENKFLPGYGNDAQIYEFGQVEMTPSKPPQDSLVMTTPQSMLVSGTWNYSLADPISRNRSPSSGGLTALQSAAAAGHELVVNLLLDEGAFVDATTGTGATALHLVASNGLNNVTKLLVSRGANVSARDNHGKTPLHLAADFDRNASVLTLLHSGASIDACDHSGSTALHSAAHKGHLSTIQLLLETGANVNAKDSCGRTALHCAAEHGHALAVRMLLDKGIDINAKTEDG